MSFLLWLVDRVAGRMCFFFQAVDGIRDLTVTGVQTCALPIFDEDDLRGLTSNPTIFEKAIGGSEDYDAQLRMLASQGKSRDEIYDELVIEDISNAADVFRPVYDRTNGDDGYVSLEVSPLLAGDTANTVFEAQRLFKRVGRPNLMIKIPATPEGIPAIEKAIAAGINVNEIGRAHV